jgi:hypothetical protein
MVKIRNKFDTPNSMVAKQKVRGGYMRYTSQLNIAIAVAGLFSSFSASAGDDAWSVFSGSSASNQKWTVNSYTPDPSRYGSAPSIDQAVPGTPDGDAAYARRMRVLYAKDAVANSTAPAEAALKQQAMSSGNCRDIVVSADTAKKAHVVRHMAPDPTQVIKNSTCFVDVLKIKIPSTSFAFVDGLVNQLSGFAEKSLCSSTQGYWNNIASAAASGNIKGLASQAIGSSGSYVPQNVYTAPATNGSTGSTSGWQTVPSTGGTGSSNNNWATEPDSPDPAPTNKSFLGSLGGWFSR